MGMKPHRGNGFLLAREGTEALPDLTRGGRVGMVMDVSAERYDGRAASNPHTATCGGPNCGLSPHHHEAGGHRRGSVERTGHGR